MRVTPTLGRCALVVGLTQTHNHISYALSLLPSNVNPFLCQLNLTKCMVMPNFKIVFIRLLKRYCLIQLPVMMALRQRILRETLILPRTVVVRIVVMS